MSTGISIASLVVSVITLALVLMLLAGKPWEPSPVETVLTPTPTAIPTTNAGLYYEKGKGYAERDEWFKAWEQFDKAIQIDPDYAKAYYNRGISSYNLDRYEDAINDYTMAIQIDPDDSNAYNNRGRAYSKLGQYEDVINDYTKLIQMYPDYADYYHLRINAYNQLDRYEDAINDYTKLIQMYPKHEHIWPANYNLNLTEALFNRGRAYSKLGQSSLADADKTKACSLIDYRPSKEAKGC
jgi:tetratricopeptide (TPR) repeat protein